MIRSDKRLDELSDVVRTNSNILISETIKRLREEPPFKGVIGVLTALYDRTDDSLVRKTIAEFMNDLKDQSLCEEVIETIKKTWKDETSTMLVASCWQSGLNYSGYSLDLARVFIKSDYLTAIECYTVIGEFIHELSRETKEEIIHLIEESPLPTVNEKSLLTLELISILDQ